MRASFAFAILACSCDAKLAPDRRSLRGLSGRPKMPDAETKRGTQRNTNVLPADPLVLAARAAAVQKPDEVDNDQPVSGPIQQIEEFFISLSDYNHFGTFNHLKVAFDLSAVPPC